MFRYLVYKKYILYDMYYCTAMDVIHFDPTMVPLLLLLGNKAPPDLLLINILLAHGVIG